MLATVANDANGNGQLNASDPRLAGVTIFVDTIRNGVKDDGEPAAVTGTSGQASIPNIPAGTWDVYQVVPTGYQPADRFDTFDRVRVRDGETTNVTFLNVAIGTTTGTVTGTVWNDLDQDGVRDATDPGIAGWTVFADLNDDRFLGSGEPSATTDVDGKYTLANLAPGRVRIREITPSGWDPTVGFDGGANADVVAGGTRVIDFGNFNVNGFGTITGSVWNDVNADGFRASGDPGLGDWTIFLDLDLDGVADAAEPTTLTDASGVFTFSSVAAGSYRVTEVLKAGWNTSPGFPTSVAATANNEDPGVATFAVFTPLSSSITGRVYNDLDGNGLIGSGETGLGGWTVFIDDDNDGSIGVGELSTVTASDGNYTLAGVPIGSFNVRQIPGVGFAPTAPGTGVQLVRVLNGSTVTGVNFGNKQRTDGAISGAAFVDTDGDGARDAGEKGLPGILVYLDLDNDSIRDPDEPSAVTSVDLFYTPAVNEAGTYAFTHLAAGTYHVRELVPSLLSATALAARERIVILAVGEERVAVDFADVYRANEIHGVVYDDQNKNHQRDAGEPGIPGVTVYVDINRDNRADPAEPRTVTDADGIYRFTTNLAPGSYVVRALRFSGHHHSDPETTGGILWPTGVSNPSIGNVTPGSITTSLAKDQTETHRVSLTLPTIGALTDKVDVFLLFDDTGSFTANSPIVRAAFPEIIAALQAAMPTVDFGFGVGRFEEYANFASESSTGRPFILNQPILSASAPGFAASIQAALDRTAPGYGGDTPETDIEALFQAATGRGFDGNNNGTTTDSGAAGPVTTQLTPGDSGDVPAFGSFTVDPSGNVLPPSGTIGGAGFRPGALPIILTATDTGFAFQPRGETSIVGLNGLTLPISAFTQTSRPTTPFDSGAGIQETITALNALGALVIGLGTVGTPTLDPRQGLEALAKLTGAVNRSTTTISNGTVDPIGPGDPMYIQISSGFGTSVSNGIVAAVKNAVSNVAVDLTLVATDPNVHFELLPETVHNVGAGQTAAFDVTLKGDGRIHQFDLQFVRVGTNVVLGSIPVVIGTPIAGDGYEYVELEDGEIEDGDDFGHWYDPALPTNTAPAFVKGADQIVANDAGLQTLTAWATNLSAGPASEADQVLDFGASTDNDSLFSVRPSVSEDGTLTYTPSLGASGVAVVTLRLHDSGGTLGGGHDTSATQTFTIQILAPVAPLQVSATFEYLTRHALVIDFDRDIGTAAAMAGIHVVNRTTGNAVPLVTPTYDPALRRATVLFAGGILPDGDYGLSIDAGSLPNLATALTYHFFVLAGDADHDHDVDFDDLVVLAQNYQMSGRSFAQGNFDYSPDGLVSFDDLVILAQHYRSASLSTLAAMMAPPETRRPTAKGPTNRRPSLGPV